MACQDKVNREIQATPTHRCTLILPSYFQQAIDLAPVAYILPNSGQQMQLLLYRKAKKMDAAVFGFC
jgi:hypothetical protein